MKWKHFHFHLVTNEEMFLSSKTAHANFKHLYFPLPEKLHEFSSMHFSRDSFIMIIKSYSRHSGSLLFVNFFLAPPGTVHFVLFMFLHLVALSCRLLILSNGRRIKTAFSRVENFISMIDCKQGCFEIVCFFRVECDAF